jgi:hypothetical protein
VKSLTKIQVDTKFGKINSVEHAVHYVIIFHLMEIISGIIGNQISQFFKIKIIFELRR